MYQLNLKETADSIQQTSPLNINELIQFLKDECESLEEEKRFLITQSIALITSIAILIWVLIQLFFDQISYDLRTEKIFEFKIVFSSLILIFFFQIYRIISGFYAIALHDQIQRIINAPTSKQGYSNIFPIFVIFIIVLIHRLSTQIFSFPTIPVQILESIFYSILLFIIGLELLGAFFVVTYENKLLEKLEKIEDNSIDKKFFMISLVGAIAYQFIILGYFFWILFIKLDIPPYPLLELQVKSGIAIISIFFILIYWAKPLYLRLNEIIIRIEQLHILMDEAFHGEITTSSEIISRRDNLKIY